MCRKQFEICFRFKKKTDFISYSLPQDHYRSEDLKFVKHLLFFFSSAWLCQESYCRGAGVHRPCIIRPSVDWGFSETAEWIQAKFYGKLPIRHIFRLFFFFIQIFHFSKFYDFFFLVFVNMRPHWSKIFKTLLLLPFSSDLNKTSW